MKLKVCGMRDPGNIKAIAALKPDFMGFIFYPGSPRYVSDDAGLSVLHALPEEIARVGVFVNEEAGIVREKVKRYGLNYAQLHGTETVSYCKELSKHVSLIRAFGIDARFRFDEVKAYASCCRYFLFDTKTEQHGGSGRSFDWELLKAYSGTTPFFVSGGIDNEKAAQLSELKSGLPMLEGIDVNSRYESEPGIKNKALLIELKQMLY